MRKVSKFYYEILALLLLFSGGYSLHSQTVLARADATPSVMTVGEVSTYSIHFLNTDSVPRLTTPRVDGLEFSPTASSSVNQSIINGRFSVETSLGWNFRATRVGSFTIPGRTVVVKDDELTIPDVEIRVVEQTEEQKSRAMMVLRLPDGPYYVGQSLSSRLMLLTRRDYHLSRASLPTAENDVFQHTELNNTQQRGSLQYQGRSYNAIYWDIVITPIKTGKTELQFRQDLELSPISRDSRFSSIFGLADSRSEPMSVFTEKLELDILPLPDTDETQVFSGAIGQFEVETSLGSTNLTQGEPTTLTLKLTGEGNFDRISPPELPDWENWRIYPPKVNFEPEDNINLKGMKSFEYILIPQSDVLNEVPAFSYSTFDPSSQSYRVTEIPAVPISVTASELTSAIDTFIPDPDSPGDEQRIPEKLLSLRPGLGTYFPAGSILWKDPSFWIKNILVGLALSLLAFWQYRRNRLRTDQRLARRHAGSRKVRKALQLSQSAAKGNDPAGFYEQARFAVQESICHLSSNPVEAKSLVTTDCLEILKEAEVSEELYQSIATLLGSADAFQFAGATPSGEALLTSQKELVSIISQLTRSTR